MKIIETMAPMTVATKVLPYLSCLLYQNIGSTCPLTMNHICSYLDGLAIWLMASPQVSIFSINTWHSAIL